MTYLAGGIDDLGSIIYAFVADDFAEGILDRGIIALDEVAVDELHGERRFTCGWRKKPSACESAAEQTARAKGKWDGVPTERLPTIAILRCFGGAGILASGELCEMRAA